jgi:type IV secretion system protein TrbL
MSTQILAADGVSDWLSDSSNDILKRIAAGTVEANQWMMLKAIDLINSGLRINLGADWLQDVMAMMRYLVLPVVGILFLLQVITALVARSPSALWRAVWGSALGLILGSGCAVLTAGFLLIVDQFSAYLLGTGLTNAQDGIKEAFAMDGAIDGSGWLVVTVVAALGILAWVMIIVILFLRKAMIIGTVVFGPFAMAGLASGKTKSWAIKWVEVVIALALSKFVICAILTLAYSSVASSITGDITDALLGSVWVMLAAFSPLAVMRFVSFAGDQITSANVSGAAGAMGNAKRAAGLSVAGAATAGGMVGGAAGWLAGHANAVTPKAAPASPASAVGGRGGPPPGAGSSGAPDGSGPGSGSGSGSPPSVVTGQPGQTPSGATGAGASVADPPAGVGPSSPAAVAGFAPSAGPEAPDGQVQPAMDAYVTRGRPTTGGNGEPVRGGRAPRGAAHPGRPDVHDVRGPRRPRSATAGRFTTGAFPPVDR